MKKRNRAFTLIEILIAASLLTAVIAAGTALAFQFTNILHFANNDPVFDRHVDGLEKFLRAYRVQASEPTALSKLPHDAGLLQGIYLKVPPTAPLLTGASAPASASMRLAMRGKSGLWLGIPTEASLASARFQWVLLSPQVTSAQSYRYTRKTDTWSEESSAPKTPPDARMLKITLNHAGKHKELWIPWPCAESNVGG